MHSNVDEISSSIKIFNQTMSSLSEINTLHQSDSSQLRSSISAMNHSLNTIQENLGIVDYILLTHSLNVIQIDVKYRYKFIIMNLQKL